MYYPTLFLVIYIDVVVWCCSFQIPLIVQCLWVTLADLDDLTSSTASVMTVLAELLSQPNVRLT